MLGTDCIENLRSLESTLSSGLTFAMTQRSPFHRRFPLATPDPRVDSAGVVQQFTQRLTQVLVDSSTPLSALQQLLQEVGDVLHPDYCWLGILDPSEQITQSLWWQPDGRIESFRGQPVSWPSSGDATLHLQSYAQGHPNGVIWVGRSHPHPWTDLDQQLLQSLAQPLAIAIRQTQMEQHLQSQTQYQDLMEQLLSAIRGDCQLDQIFELAVSGLGNLLQSSRSLIFTLKYADPRFKSKERGQAFQARATVDAEWQAGAECPESPSNTCEQRNSDARQGLGGPLLVDPDTPIFSITDCHLCQHLLTHPTQPLALLARNADEEAIACRNNRDIPSQSEVCLSHALNSAPFLNLERFPSILMVPLESQGTVLGGIVVQQTGTRPWQPDEIGFVRLVAAQLSMAMIQSRTLRQIHSLVDERTAQLRRSLDVQAKLYEKTRQQVEQLRAMNRIMEEFLSTVSHELLTPLTSMKLAIRMLRESHLSPEQRDRYLSILEQQCLQETRLINDLLALQKLESCLETTQLQQIDLCFLIRDLQDAMASTLSACQLTLELDLPSRPLLLRTDTDSLHRILTELLTNARKYSEPGSVIRLEVHTLNPGQLSSHIALSLCNQGSGIAPDELPLIFEKFRRGKDATQNAIPGIGLGLALVKGLVAHLGGTIVASSHPLPNSATWETCFTVQLPQTANLLREAS